MSESQQRPEICDVNGAKCYCQHLTNWKGWNKYDKVWSSATSRCKWRFCCCHCCLSSLISNSPPSPLLGRQSCQMPEVCTPGGRREESWSFNFIYNPKLKSSAELYIPHIFKYWELIGKGWYSIIINVCLNSLCPCVCARIYTTRSLTSYCVTSERIFFHRLEYFLHKLDLWSKYRSFNRKYLCSISQWTRIKILSTHFRKENDIGIPNEKILLHVSNRSLQLHSLEDRESITRFLQRRRSCSCSRKMNY